MLLPGAGQVYLGARRRGLVLLGLTAVLLVGLLVVVDRARLESIDRRLVAAVLVVDVALLALRLFAVVDASRGGWAVGLAVLVALTAAPHVAAGWVTVRSYDVLDSVFADEEPCGTACDRGSVLLAHVVGRCRSGCRRTRGSGRSSSGSGRARWRRSRPTRASSRTRSRSTSKPWTTILLLGTDEGPGNWGARTDTIILAAVQHGTGRAAAFGVPRNLAQVPLGPKGTPFKEPINALYGRSGGGETGARNAEAGRLEPARDPRRLLRARQPRRLRRPRRRARRRRDPRQGAAPRRGDAGRLGRAEAEDRRRARRSATASTAARRSRTSARGRTRATTRGWRASAAS